MVFGNNSFFKKHKTNEEDDIRRNNNKADSVETGRIVIAHLLP